MPKVLRLRKLKTINAKLAETSGDFIFNYTFDDVLNVFNIFTFFHHMLMITKLVTVHVGSITELLDGLVSDDYPCLTPNREGIER